MINIIDAFEDETRLQRTNGQKCQHQPGFAYAIAMERWRISADIFCSVYTPRPTSRRVS